MKVVIIGGVAGGASTAARLRRNDETAEIVMVERGEYISYANCGLPYYIGEVINERDRIFVQTASGFAKTFKIDVRVKTEALSVDRAAKIVLMKDLASGREYRESYDQLVLSPGAEPVRPPIKGIQDPVIFTLRNVADTDTIKQYIDRHSPRKAVVVGAGFIGLEMAENLHARGLRVTIVEMANQVMNVVDPEIAAEVHQHLKSKNVEFYLGDGVSSFERSGAPAATTDGPAVPMRPEQAGRLHINLKSGRRIEADLVILSIGVRPDNKLAKDSGLEIGVTGGIKVNQFLQTSDPAIWAVGDAIEFTSPISGKPTITYLAGPANKQGRICADNLAFGAKAAYSGAIATAIAKVFDVTVASTGLAEKNLHQLGIECQSVITHSGSHAGYYPGATGMSIKTIFAPGTGRLLGAQIIGYDGVDTRIDMIAAVLRHGGGIRELADLEHAYAPPYSSAKDPVNIAGFVAENVLAGRSKHIHWSELAGCGMDELCLLDVRTPEEFALGTLEGAVNIPTYELRDRLGEVPRDKTVVVFCGVGLRAWQAESLLRQSGWNDVYNLSGGYKTYKIATQKQANEDIFAGDTIGTDDGIYQTDPAQSGLAAQAARAAAAPPAADTPLAAPSTPAAAGPQPAFQFKTYVSDATGMQCPGPILKLKKEMERLQPGDRLRQTATDAGFARDVESWCQMTGHKFLGIETAPGQWTATIEKSAPRLETPLAGGQPGVLPAGFPARVPSTDESTLIVFSQDLDRALASFVIANGAAAAGKKVTMFFTFWGLSVIKKQQKPRGVVKDFMGRMFGMMLPANSTKLGLSKINMGGMGAAMMRLRMKQQNVDSLESMIATAIDSGVHLIACQMSMDVMGVKKEEFVDGIEIGGVATYLENAGKAAVNLFI